MREKAEQVRALVLLSGGLDSILAAKLLLEQGVKVEGICFYSNFFDCRSARKAARRLNIKLREVDISSELLEIIRAPKHGYGAGLNPCIDCHALMIKKAGEIMKAEGSCFVATGEVLGERPMSQHKKALKIIEKEAKLEGYLLRPLSAKLLEPTTPEVRGLVIRDKLMDISGRGRKKQMELAKKFGITDYPTPAGGCMLTQDGFVSRLKELMEKKSDFNPEDVELSKIGRHFWDNSTQIILGRDKEENEMLVLAKTKKNALVVPDNFAGPSALVRGEQIGDKSIEKAKELVVQYSPKVKNNIDINLNFKIGK
ncbi:MAG: hypothetical protein AUK17_01600 [Parcubacteria group bacterium CG2_30_44_18]|nr:MAG: hypothetical protein AUK17_01600 [Parcubacteria group bacterium CG2_30_44_18]